MTVNMVIFENKKNWISLFIFMTLDGIKDQEKIIKQDDVGCCDRHKYFCNIWADLNHLVRNILKNNFIMFYTITDESNMKCASQ